MWIVLASSALACIDSWLLFRLIMGVAAIRPAGRQRYAFLVATPLAVGVGLSLPASSPSDRIWLLAALHALSAVTLLGLRWQAVLLLGMMDSSVSVAATTSAGLLPFTAPLGSQLIFYSARWVLLTIIIAAAERANRRGQGRLDLQSISDVPWPMAGVFLLEVFMHVTVGTVSNNTARLRQISDLSAVGMAFLVVWLFFSTYDSLRRSRENAELRFHAQTIETLTLELRQFRHNYRNILHGLSGYIENAEWVELKRYFQDIVRETEQAELNSYALALKNVTNYALFGLLTEKLQFAKEHGVEMDLNVVGVFGQTVMNGTDLCQVMGVFLDNAIEAAMEAAAGKVLVTLRYDGAYQQIVVSNTCLNKPTVSQVNDIRYSTKGPDRGKGLYFAKLVLSKYDSILHNTALVDGEFKQELIIPIAE